MLKNLFGKEYGDLLNNENMLEKTLVIVEKIFKDITDKQGKPYIGHLTRVAERVTETDEKVVALLHDIIEDIEEVSATDLIDIGYPKHIVEAVVILSKPIDMKHVDYINQILRSKNMLAIMVKKADLEDNTDDARLAELDESTQIRLREKFAIAYQMVCEYLDNLS